jgi:predicted  nucleic acid-binding Zn-ribbon protein
VMIGRSELPLETKFGESSIAVRVKRIDDMLDKLSLSIEELKKNILNEKKAFDEVSIRNKQYAEDIRTLEENMSKLSSQLKCDKTHKKIRKKYRTIGNK